MTLDDFRDAALTNPANRALLERLPALGLPQCHLVAGCLFQALWNARSGQAPDWGVPDYDIFYFDESDLSWDAEDRVIRTVKALAADLGILVEPRNQARVHLWYADRFGDGYPQLGSARDGIDRYLVACTCVGIDVASSAVYAPYGLAELAQGVLRMNGANPRPALFRAKAQSYRARWPWLTILEPAA